MTSWFHGESGHICPDILTRRTTSIKSK